MPARKLLVAIARTLGAVALLAALALLAPAGARAQVYTPQVATGLTVTFDVQRLGGSRILVVGDVRNTSLQAYERVVVLAEGLDDSGQVVSRGRGYVLSTVAARSQAPYEVRVLASGRERRFRVSIDSYQLSSGTQNP